MTTRRVPSLHYGDAKVYGHTTTAMHENECTSPQDEFQCRFSSRSGGLTHREWRFWEDLVETFPWMHRSTFYLCMLPLYQYTEILKMFGLHIYIPVLFTFPPIVVYGRSSTVDSGQITIYQAQYSVG